MTDNFPAIQNNSPVLTGSYSFEYDGDVYTVDNNKLYNADHEVAVVWSPGYGGAWSADYHNVDPTDARVAILTLTGTEAMVSVSRWDDDIPVRIKDRKFYMYDETRGEDLEIEWIPAGGLFRITEYDGYESIDRNYDIDWSIA
jgi:hypothetical protein